MPVGDGFYDCLVKNLEALSGYGKKRIGDAAAAYDRIRDSHIASGASPIDAGYEAIAYVLTEINDEILRKQAALRKNINIMASANARSNQAETLTTGFYGKGGKEKQLAAGLRSHNEDQKFIKDAPSVQSEEYRLHGWYHGILTRVAPSITTRRAFGRRPPAQQQSELIDEFYGVNTGNAEAKEGVKALRQIFTMAYDDIRANGVRVKRYNPAENLPVNISPNRLLQKNGALNDAFVNDMKGYLDFNSMQWPDGRRVLPDEHDMYLNAMRATINSGGKNSGFEHVWGEVFDKQFMREVIDGRNLRFKDADSWRAAHAKYADGDVFTTLQSTLTHLVRTGAKHNIYGPQPDRMIHTIASMAQKRLTTASSSGDTAAARALPRLNKEIRQFHQEAAVALQSNPMDPNSSIALTVGTASNLVTTAQLGSAVVANVMGDTVNLLALTMAENRGVHSLVRTMTEYVKAQIPGRAHSTLVDVQASGYMIDDLVFNDVQTSRLDLAHTVAPTWSKAWARVWTVAGGVPRHTNAFRHGINEGFLLDMARNRTSKLTDVPETQQNLLRNAGITDTMWDEIRAKMATKEVRPGVHRYDSVESYNTMKRDLAERMHRAQVNEVNGVVMLPTNEASVKLRLGVRPDTLPGALLHSTTMYTAQPLAAAYIVLRNIMNGKMSRGKRVATYAAFGMSMVVTGALAMQIRALLSGREVENMEDPDFWLKASLAGGAFNIWGGFITGLGNEDSGEMLRKLGGPIAAGIFDTSVALKETAFQMVGASDDQDGLRHLAEAFERYIGPKPFYAGAILNREVYERLKEISDPVGYRRSVSTRIRNSRERGQVYAPGWKPNDRPITSFIN